MDETLGHVSSAPGADDDEAANEDEDDKYPYG